MQKIDKYSIDDLQSVSILSIADDLGLNVNRHKKCLCPFHEDKKPSLKFWTEINSWKCYGCGEKGTNIDLVMKKKDLTFHEACEWIARQYNIMLRDDRPYPITHNPQPKIHTSQPKVQNMFTLDNNLIAQCQDLRSAFCRSILSTGILTESQLAHAADVYKLGTTQDDGVVFWQIDQDNHVRDGKIMFYNDDCHRDHSKNPTWVSYRLKKKGTLTQEWRATYCLLGLHLLADDKEMTKKIIAIVESEKTAIICSELIPMMNNRPVIWLATGGMDFLTIDSLRPLVEYSVTIFPDTDTTGQTFAKWQNIVDSASKVLSHPFYISNLLEQHANKEQKERKIDIVDFILEKDDGITLYR